MDEELGGGGGRGWVGGVGRWLGRVGWVDGWVGWKKDGWVRCKENNGKNE